MRYQHTKALSFFCFFVHSFIGFSAASEQATQHKNCDSCKITITSLDTPIDLTGQWLFTRNDSTENALPGISTEDWVTVKTPGSWDKAYDDKKKFRVGWYRANFEFNPDLVGKTVLLLLDTYVAPFDVYLDGKKLFERKATASESYRSIQAYPLKFKITQTHHTVAIRVDTILMVGIYQQPFKIIEYQPSDTSFATFQFMTGEFRFIAGHALLFFSFFFLFLMYKTRYTFYLLVSAAALGVYFMHGLTAEFYYKYFSPESLLKWTYVAVAGLVSAHWLIAQTYAVKKSTKATAIYLTFLGLHGISFLGLMLIHFNLDMFQLLRKTLFMGCLLISAHFLVVIASNIKTKQKGLRILLISESIFALSASHDVLLALGKIDSISMLPFGALVATIGAIWIASARFADTFMHNKRLVVDLKSINENLESIVQDRTKALKQKTYDIQTMLQNLPEGIFTIDVNAEIHNEYSKFLEDILETDEIAGKNYLQRVFGQSSLNKDQMDSLDAAVGSCIGESAINFEFNSHLLPHEVELIFEETQTPRKKIIELTWSPITDCDDQVEKMMIAIRDVTEIKKLQSEAKEKAIELEMVGELLKVSPDKFFNFHENSKQFIDENRQIIKENQAFSDEVINKLFRNMHTIKGNSRTYGFSYLTAVVHEAEHIYDSLRNDTSIPWDQDALLRDLEQVEHTLSEYYTVDQEVLGRNNGLSQQAGGEQVVINQSLYQDLLELLNTSDLDPSNTRLISAIQQLELIEYLPIKDMLAGVTTSLASLANDLNKAMPNIKIQDNNIMLKKSFSVLIENCYMHIMRNSMDHGIEKPDIRVQRGKPEQGTITLQCRLNKDFYEMTYFDDGQGLNLKAIKNKGIDLGLIHSYEEHTSEELANLIFKPGFSTADEVTEVSGRGVGMDAVIDFIKRENGSIFVELTQSADNETQLAPFKIVIKLPSSCVKVSSMKKQEDISSQQPTDVV